MVHITSLSFLIALTLIGSFGISNAFAYDNGYKMIGDVTPVLTFTFRDGVETHSFPVFDMGENFVSDAGVSFYVEGNVEKSPLLHKALDEAYLRAATIPSIEFRGIVGNYPMLYKHVDDGIKIQSVSGPQMKNLADIDVQIVSDGQIIRGFNYSDCRAIDYRFVTETGSSPEESYTKSQFALVNIFDFECLGYHPNNPIYDAMFVIPKADNTSTNDLRNTERWERGFYVE